MYRAKAAGNMSHCSHFSSDNMVIFLSHTFFIPVVKKENNLTLKV